MNPSLFGEEDVHLTLTADEWATFQRDIVASGGAQGLLHKLRDCHIGGRELIVPRPLIDKAHHYAYAYGNGGFQDRFRVVCAAASRVGWTPGPAPRPAKNSGGAFGRSRR